MAALLKSGKLYKLCLLGGLLSLLLSCQSHIQTNTVTLENSIESYDTVKKPSKKIIEVTKDVTINAYFDYMDSLVLHLSPTQPNRFSEHVLVWNNPWIMDTLAHTDYYLMMARDSFVYDQKKMVALPKESRMLVPDSLTTLAILKGFEQVHIDVNIPEFKLRILKDSMVLHTFPIRVGQNRKRYLAMSQNIVDLRTITGRGTIVNHVKDPDFYNPVDGKRFTFTKRDDGKVTYMPRIPWIETEINGVKNGQMIHPTTNPNTLGKAYSNGCIGIGEADAWIIYYHAPIGTKIQVRYDLEIQGDDQEIITLKDIYGYSKK